MRIAIASPKRELGTRAKARTSEIKRCLLMEPDYIFMMDDDQLLSDEFNLVDLLELDADIAVMDAANKGYEDSNVVYNPDGTIAYCTISCCLIKASVFERFPTEPWFTTLYEYREQQPVDGKHTYEVALKYQDDNRGEDVWFTRHVLSAGMSIKVLKGYKSPHFDLAALGGTL